MQIVVSKSTLIKAWAGREDLWFGKYPLHEETQYKRKADQKIPASAEVMSV